MAETRFTVDLEALSATISAVRAERDRIASALARIDIEMSGLGAYWKAPSYGSFESFKEWYGRESTGLLALLDDILGRLQKSYDNYRETETANIGNLKQ